MLFANAVHTFGAGRKALTTALGAEEMPRHALKVFFVKLHSISPPNPRRPPLRCQTSTYARLIVPCQAFLTLNANYQRCPLRHGFEGRSKAHRSEATRMGGKEGDVLTINKMLLPSASSMPRAIHAVCKNTRGTKPLNATTLESFF